MRMYILLAAFMILAACASVFAASGDKATTFTPLAGTPANSTATSKAPGELKYDASYLYVNISTASRPHWRRISVGGSF